MSNMTISEDLFEQFCKENSIPYSRIERQEYKTPDYHVYFDKHLVIAEVKQLDPNVLDREHRAQGRQHGTVTYFEKSGHRVRLKIDSAKKQLKLASKDKYPAILVLYNNVPIGSIDMDDIKTAMYGHESARKAFPDYPDDRPIEIKHVGFGSERKFTPNHNTNFSAIAFLYKSGGDLCLSIFHNIHAKRPIDPAWLRRSAVRHLTLSPKVQGAFQEWLEI